MTEQPNYYAVLSADVRYDEKISSSAKLLYAEITALANKQGYAWATNKYFANLYGVSIVTVSRWISDLEKAGYLQTDIQKDKGNYRKIYLHPINKNVNTYKQKCYDPINKNVKTLIIQDNNTSNKILTNVSIGVKPKGNEQINKMFDYWKKTTGLPISSKIQGNRNACSNLIKKHGNDGVMKLINGVAKSQADQYAPRIADFIQLQSKLSELLLWGKQNITNKAKVGLVR